MNRNALFASAVLVWFTAIAFSFSGRGAGAADAIGRQKSARPVAVQVVRLRDGGAGPYQSAGGSRAYPNPAAACDRADGASRALLDTGWVNDVVNRVSDALDRRHSRSPGNACASNP